MQLAADLGVDFRRLWAAATTSNVGDGVFLTALPLIAVSVTREPFAVSTVTFGLTVPWLVFALVAGALVDRWDRVRLMWVVDLIRFALTAGLAVVVATGSTTIALLVAFAVALGTAETFFDTAWLSVVPRLVGPEPERLTRANARIEGANTVANGFVGPPAGTALFALAHALPVVVNAVSYLASAVFLHRISSPPPATRPASDTMRRDIGAGLRLLMHHRLLLALALVVGVMNFALAGVGSLLLLLLEEEADAGATAYAVILTIAAGSAVVGSLVAGRMSRTVAPARLLPALVVAVAVGLVVIGAEPHVLAIGAGGALLGLSSAVWNVVTLAIRQGAVPDEMLGRINSVYRLLAYGTLPLGSLTWGAVAQVAGIRAPFVVGGLLVLATVPVMAHRLRAVPRADRSEEASTSAKTVTS